MKKEILQGLIDSHKELEKILLSDWLKNDEDEIELFFLSPTDICYFLENYNINVESSLIDNDVLFIYYEEDYSKFTLSFNYFSKELKIKYKVK